MGMQMPLSIAGNEHRELVQMVMDIEVNRATGQLVLHLEREAAVSGRRSLRVRVEDSVMARLALREVCMSSSQDGI